MSVTEDKRRAGPDARRRRTVVGVIGSGTSADPCCQEVGQLIASLGCDLLTGGGRGVMEAVSRAFFETSPRAGLVIGVVPGKVGSLDALERREPSAARYRLHPGYPNPWVEIAIYTHLPHSGDQGTLRSSRNHINVLSSDAIVALPGQAGTASEMWLATQYGVPIIAYGDHGGRTSSAIDVAESLDDVRAFLVRQLSLTSSPTRYKSAPDRP